MDTSYPFGDVARVAFAPVVDTAALLLRIPSWAAAATVSVDGGPAYAVPEDDVGDFHVVQFPGKALRAAAGPHTVVVAFNVAPRVETGWGISDGVSVHWGALQMSLALEPQFQTLATYAYEARDVAITTNSSWRFALEVSRTNASGAWASEMNVTGPLRPNPGVPYSGTASPPVAVQLRARVLSSWNETQSAASSPPPSPACADGCECGAQVQLVLVPHGTTDLRIGVFPTV